MNTPKEARTARPNFWLRAIEQRKHELGREYRASLGDVARTDISDEDYATTMATLEKMARNLGWSEQRQAEGGFGPGRGFGHRRGHRHPGMMRGFHPHHDAAPHTPTESTES